MSRSIATQPSREHSAELGTKGQQPIGPKKRPGDGCQRRHNEIRTARGTTGTGPTSGAMPHGVARQPAAISTPKQEAGPCPTRVTKN